MGNQGEGMQTAGQRGAARAYWRSGWLPGTSRATCNGPLATSCGLPRRNTGRTLDGALPSMGSMGGPSMA
eukprot:5547013-Lingulodinium_polyedra.AAC.1